MDFRIQAFVGPISALRQWRREIPSAVVVALTDDLGLAPITSRFLEELRRKLKTERQSENEVIQFWGARASKGCTIAYIWADSREDFFSDGVQYALAWTNEQAVLSKLNINDALRVAGVRAKAGEREFGAADLGRYPDTESWAAAAILSEAVDVKHGAVPALITALKNFGRQLVDIAVRRHAAKALGQQRRAAEQAIPVLAESARTDLDFGVRQEAIRALGTIGRQAVPVLITLMRTGGDAITRAEAAKALGEMGDNARTAVPDLIESLHERDDLVRLVAVRAVGKMYLANRQLRSALRALADSATADRSESVRVSAIRTLATMGPEAIPTLIQVLEADRDRDARRDAADGLADIGRGSHNAAHALAGALHDREALVRAAAARALGRIEVRDEEVVNSLSRAQNDDDEYVRDTARKSLRNIHPPDASP